MISVIIPVYNAEKYLQECVDSVINQTYKDLQIILVDDGSTDNSGEIIDRYMEQDKRVLAIHKSNGGPNSARKEGIKHAKGRYVTFVDADDYIDKSMCEALERAATSHEAQLVGCGLINSKIKRRGYKYKDEELKGTDCAKQLFDMKNFYIVNRVIALYAYLYETDIIRNILLEFDERIDFSEDVICLFQVMLDSDKIVYISDQLYYYRENPDSLTKNHEKRQYDSQRYLYKYGKKQLDLRKAPDIVYREMERLIFQNCLIHGYEEAFSHLNYLFPFPEIKVGSRFVLYGAGAMGIEIERYIKASDKYEMVAWVDKKAETVSLGKGITAPQSLNEIAFDYVAVAVTNPKIRLEIKQQLIDMGIDENKIKVFDENVISYQALPDNFW